MFNELALLAPPPTVPLLAGGYAKFQYEVLNPPAYAPDLTTYPGADYYEIQLHEAWGYQGLAGAGLFPLPPAGFTVPNGKQWTGLRCSPVAPATTCSGGVTAGTPLFTPIWGIGSKKNFPVQALQTFPAAPHGAPASWSNNDYFATWPSISIWATKGKPVVVKWINEFPNQHVFCPHPEAADWTCAIDRTFMGVKAKIDPALANGVVPWQGVNQYGSPQQPDDSWVTHLHGGDIPSSVDGFAEKWFGNANTAVAYNGVSQNFVSPPFENPLNVALKRPAGVNFATYAYPGQPDEATIWWHDHTLGKTHHNVIAGPAGFFPVFDPARHAVGGDLAWLNELGPTASATNKSALGVPLYDVFLAIQDRSFNDDGSINFSNGLGQPPPVPPLAAGASSITAGANPQVHPVWVPEYFGDHVLVNGVLWPKLTADAGWYRLRIVDGSDSRCYTIGFSTLVPAPGTKPNTNVNFYVLANDQGYLRTPVLAPAGDLTMCPGERYEILVDFSAQAGKTITMVNKAPAPFPAGITPWAAASPYADMNVIMQFNVKTAATSNPTRVLALNPAARLMNFVDLRPAAGVIPAGSIVRQVYLNERIDGVTLAPLGMQLNGVPFEYKVTETPKKGSTEYWQFVNLTVDAHPMHPHLVKHQGVSRQNFNVGAYKTLLCGQAKCQPGTAPGGEMQVVPDVTPTLALAAPTLITAATVEGGWKDTTQAPPGMVTTIVATWDGHWSPVAAAGVAATAPGTAGGPADGACPLAGAPCATAAWTFEDVSSGPYVWHCHINSHEDSEMMRTSMVVP